jgi:hypothetical protein
MDVVLDGYVFRQRLLRGGHRVRVVFLLPSLS